MEEKTMVNDVLENVKAELTTYQGAISEAANTQLRHSIRTIQNSRNKRIL